jgi:hypothetical protein
MTDDGGVGQLPPQVERELVSELAELTLELAAPEELAVFPETAEEYFDDPQAVLDPKRRDEAVGFGLDAALLTPFVLAVATPVIQFLVATVGDAVLEESKPLVARLIRRLFRRADQASEPADRAAPLSVDQARQVREIAYQRAKGLGLSENQATTLADSMVGSLLSPRQANDVIHEAAAYRVVG